MVESAIAYVVPHLNFKSLADYIIGISGMQLKIYFEVKEFFGKNYDSNYEFLSLLYKFLQNFLFEQNFYIKKN